jgi:hypothetical protein
MRLYTILTALAGSGALVACNESLVPQYNTPTGFIHNISALQNEMTGALSGARTDLVVFQTTTEGFARNSAYFTNSEERFVTQLTGQQPLDDDNFGAGVWNNESQDVKDADSIIAVLPTLTNSGAALPVANMKALQGAMEVIKAVDYMYILLAHDTVGIAINNPGGVQSGAGLAPILCARDGWREMIAILDTAQADFAYGGPNTILGFPGTEFPGLLVPPGFSAIGNTAGGWMNLVYALRGRFRVELAYAVANGPGGIRPTPTTAGGPDVNQLDSAIIDITASSLYSPSLSAGEAVAANDLGVFHSFSSAAGDLPNPNYVISAADFVLEQAAQQIDTLHDQRFLAKYAQAPAQPTSPGSQIASTYAYFSLTLSTPIPIVRNIELQFLLARAYLGLGQYAKAAQIVDNVRTVVGGLPSALPLAANDYVHVRDFLMREMIPSLMGDDTADQIAAIRDLGLIMPDLDLWAHTLVPGTTNQYYTDYHTSEENIPAIERQQRNNNYAPVCP